MEDGELVPKNLLYVIQIKRDLTLKRSYSSSFFTYCNIDLALKPTKPVAVETECTGWWRSGWDEEKTLAQAWLLQWWVEHNDFTLKGQLKRGETDSK